ncbi:MAG: 1-deoxy-D-xylulose-5-phosphate synthase N-terminal domain-containing protein, partial [Oscillospiraceae bacterium]
IPVVGDRLRDLVAESKSMVKQAIYPSTFFEEFGFAYLGPVDGHNIKSLCDVLTQAKTLDCPSLIHIETLKGKGYCHAEHNPGAFHGISKFDVQTGEPCQASGESFSSVFGEELVRLAHENQRVCAITAAMEHGTGLKNFSREFKGTGRYYDIGIAEGFGVTFSAALGAGGMIPVFAVYSTFLQRGFDQLIHDAAIERRHVVIGVDRAGIVGEDGETHQGIFDPAFLSAVPGLEALAPANYAELRAMLRRAVNDCDGPVAVRYPRGGEDSLLADYAATGASFDHLDCGKRGCVVVTYGRTFAAARRATATSLTPASIIKLNRIIPIDPAAIAAACPYDRVIVVEEAWAVGGIASQFLAGLSLAGYRGRSTLRAIEGFVPQSSVGSALHRLGLDAEGILTLIDG